tara:strand:+ start:1097 stop:1837 length:741 start_codon:yes stop_codon:yes gene_type:complete
MSNDKLLVYGLRAISEAIHSEKNINKVYIQKGLKSQLANSLIKNLREFNIEHSYVPVEKLNRLTHKNHQGFVATISPVKYLSINDLSNIIELKGKNCQILILDQISDVRNFGAIIRTAECTEIDCIVVPSTGSAPINGDTIKTSSGAIFNVPICKVSHIKDAIFLLKQSNIKIFGATEKAKKNIYETDLKKPNAIIMGSEGKGLSKSVIDMCDELVKIPLFGKTLSLNVSVACGTILFETIRQQKY